MRYIECTTLNCQIYASQREELNRIKLEIESEYNMKIPLSSSISASSISCVGVSSVTIE